MKSLRVADLVREVVSEGRPVTARTVARRVGACRFLCEAYLLALAKAGEVERRVCRPTHPKSNPYSLYLPTTRGPR